VRGLEQSEGINSFLTSFLAVFFGTGMHPLVRGQRDLSGIPSPLSLSGPTHVDSGKSVVRDRWLTGIAPNGKFG
jgi:hypothetical protein